MRRSYAMHRWFTCVLIWLTVACGGAQWHGERNDTSSNVSVHTIADEPVAPGSLLWAAHATGSGRCLGRVVVALADGGAVASGLFTHEAIFGPGEARETTLTATSSNTDMFVAKYDKDGKLEWVTRVSGPGGEDPVAIAALPDGSVIIAGEAFIWRNTTTTFGAGEPGETNLVPSCVLPSCGLGFIFVAKFNPDGALVWAKAADGRALPSDSARDDVDIERNYGHFQVTDLAASPDGSAIITGYFNGTLTLGRGERHEVTLTTSGDSDVFIAKLDAAGSLVWATRSGGIAEESASGVIVLPDGSPILAGTSQSLGSFGSNEGGDVVLRSTDGDNDVFIAKFSAQGTLRWAQASGGSLRDSARGIAPLPDGGMVVAGQRDGVPRDPVTRGTDRLTVAGDPFHLAKYDAQGSQVWARSLLHNGQAPYINAIAALDDGRAVVTGTFHRDVTFGVSAHGDVTLSAVSTGATDIFVSEYDREGALNWALRIGTDRDDTGAGIAVARDGGVLVTGTIGDGNFKTRGTFANTRTTLEPGFFLAKLAP